MAKNVEAFTKPVKNGFRTESKILHINCDIGENNARIELIKPPKEINGKKITDTIFAKIEYKLNNSL